MGKTGPCPGWLEVLARPAGRLIAQQFDQFFEWVLQWGTQEAEFWEQNDKHTGIELFPEPDMTLLEKAATLAAVNNHFCGGWKRGRCINPWESESTGGPTDWTAVTRSRPTPAAPSPALESLSYRELQAEAKQRGLNAGGKKPELLERLKQHEVRRFLKRIPTIKAAMPFTILCSRVNDIRDRDRPTMEPKIKEAVRDVEVALKRQPTIADLVEFVRSRPRTLHGIAFDRGISDQVRHEQCDAIVDEFLVLRDCVNAAYSGLPNFLLIEERVEAVRKKFSALGHVAATTKPDQNDNGEQSVRWQHALDESKEAWLRLDALRGVPATSDDTAHKLVRSTDPPTLSDDKLRRTTSEFTVAALRDMTGLGNTALNNYAKLGGVATARRGQRNYRYSKADVRTILQKIIDTTSEDALRSKCCEALANLR